jgi:hypothetical protein
VGLAISGAIFVNRAFAGLTVVLPDFPREEIQWGISGTSGEFFKALPAGTQELALNVLINALRKVYGTDPSYDFLSHEIANGWIVNGDRFIPCTLPPLSAWLVPLFCP